MGNRLNQIGAGGRIYSSVPKKENAYDAEWQHIKAQLKREEEEYEKREREKNKQIYDSLISYMRNENQRKGAFSGVLMARQEGGGVKIRDDSRYLTDGNNTTPLAAAMLPDVAYDHKQYKYMTDSWEVLADEIEASMPTEAKNMLRSKADLDMVWVRNNIGAYVENLVRWMPMPPHLRVAVNVGCFFTITVCEALMEVQKKRAQELAWLESRTEYSQDEKKRRMQNKMIGWFLEEVGKGILDRILDGVLERYHVPMHLRNQIKVAWSTFVVGDKWLGHWQPIIERKITRIAPSYWLSAQYDGASESSSSPLVLRGIDEIGRVKHSLT